MRMLGSDELMQLYNSGAQPPSAVSQMPVWLRKEPWPRRLTVSPHLHRCTRTQTGNTPHTTLKAIFAIMAHGIYHALLFLL